MILSQILISLEISHLGLNLPKDANTASTSNGQHLCWIGINHWILLAPIDQESQLLDRLTPNDPSPDCRIVHVSDAYNIFTVVGKQADEILAIASPLDTRQTRFADGGATYTEFYGIRALVVPILELIKFRVSNAHKYRAILGAEMYSIEGGIEAGLIDEIVEPTNLMEASMNKIKDLASMGHPSYTLTKALLIQELHQEINNAISTIESGHQ